MALFNELNNAFLKHVAQTKPSGWCYYSPADKVKEEFCEWVKANYPNKAANIESLWATFSYEYSAMMTM